MATERVGTRERTTPSALARTAAVVVMAALVAFAGVVLLRPVPQTTTTATVTSAAPARVCLDVAGGPASLCLDAEHVDHLALAGLAPGECVDVSYQGRIAVDESLTRVDRRAC